MSTLVVLLFRTVPCEETWDRGNLRMGRSRELCCPPPTLGRRPRSLARKLHPDDLEDGVLETDLRFGRTPEIDSGLWARDTRIFGIAQHREVRARARTIVNRRPDGLRPVNQIRGGSNHDGGMAGCEAYRSRVQDTNAETHWRGRLPPGLLEMVGSFDPPPSLD